MIHQKRAGEQIFPERKARPATSPQVDCLICSCWTCVENRSQVDGGSQLIAKRQARFHSEGDSFALKPFLPDLTSHRGRPLPASPKITKEQTTAAWNAKSLRCQSEKAGQQRQTRASTPTHTSDFHEITLESPTQQTEKEQNAAHPVTDGGLFPIQELLHPRDITK